MAIFSVPLSPGQNEFIKGLPSPLDGLVEESEWNEFVDALNGMLSKTRSFWEGVRGTLEREMDEYIGRKNIVFEKRGFRVLHPRDMRYQKLEVLLCNIPG
jgi:hypothetical protein